MRSSLNIRTRVMLAIVIFISLLFAVTEYQHANKTQQYLIDSEISKQKLLVRTILPVLSTNLAFGLQDSTRLYLNEVAASNENIESIELREEKGSVLYWFSRQNSVKPEAENASQSIVEPVHDELTGALLGTLKIHFSNLYHLRLLDEHQAFSFNLFIMILAALGLFMLFLNHAFKPLKTLKEQVEAFDPKNNNFQLDRSSANNEIGIIQNALADMIYRIRLYTQELDLLTNNLECKVKERTRELEAVVTEIKTQEKIMISQSRLAAMGEMMSMVAHQWRQPLATMSLMISNYNINALLHKTERDDRDKILENISDTLGYLSNTVDDFQTYFKPEKIVEERAVHEVIERAVEFTKVRIDYSNITLFIHCPVSLMITVHTNELVQVLINIINNAIDAINSVRPSSREITIRAEEKSDSVTLSIADTGGGIDEKILESIFEPYFSTKSKNGTGLGLYMAKMIITRHEAGMIVAENVDNGTRFTITLPKIRVDQPEISI